MIDINQHKFKAGDIIKPIKGKTYSCNYNIQHIKKCKVHYITIYSKPLIQIQMLKGKIFYGEREFKGIVTINPIDFEFYNSIDNYEIF
jgi:hypothetical protein